MSCGLLVSFLFPEVQGFLVLVLESLECFDLLFGECECVFLAFEFVSKVLNHGVVVHACLRLVEDLV